MSWSDIEATEALENIRENRNLEYNFAAGKEGADIKPEIRKFFSSLNDSVIRAKDPDGLKNHNKFFLFEELDFQMLARGNPTLAVGVQPEQPCPALYLASANITDTAREKHNNAILIPITVEICRAISDYYQDLLSEYKKVGIFNNTVENRYATYKSDICKIYFYPRRPSSGEFIDTLEGVLKNIQHYEVEGLNSTCEIRIVVPGWYNNRIGIAKALTHIKGNNTNARIAVIGRPVSTNDIDMGGDIYNELTGANSDSLNKGDIEIFFQDSDNDVNIHSKYMLVHAPYKTSSGGYKMQKLVWMGSPNYSRAAIIEHWEMLCKLYEDSGAYDRYLKNFRNLITSGSAYKDAN